LKRAIATYGTGSCKQQLEYSLPTFKAFAKLHGYDLFIAPVIGIERHPVWYKIPMMQELLKTYDEVLWLDSDLVIVDGREDLNVPENYWQAMVFHHTGDGEVPNCGMWLVRKAMLPYLQTAWGMTQYLNDRWREQSAIIEQMGYVDIVRPVYLGEPTDLYAHTFQLDNSWNVHKWDKPQPDKARIQHATMYSDILGVMAGWARQAEETWLS
jgi:hypothetical protein